MKNLLYSLFLLAILGCQSNGDTTVYKWKKKHEVHFFNDCKEKIKANHEDEKNADRYCECLLLKMKQRYKSGKEALKNLTDDVISAMETECTEELNPLN